MKKKDIKKKSPAFGYFGSKHRLALPIIKHLPPHNAWVDAFCGSAAVTLAKAPAPIEIINDINGEIINFFEQLRRKPESLYRVAVLTPYARFELAHSRSNGKKDSKVERARKFLVSSMMSINGVFGDHKGGFSYSDSYSRNGMEARVSRWYHMPERLVHVVERLRHTRLEKQDARKLIKAYLNRPATLIYLDPPYFADRSKGYDFDQSDEAFHEELLALANKAKSMVVISGYDNPLYRKCLSHKKGWRLIKLPAHTQGSNGKRQVRTELLWQNKHCVKAIQMERVPIRLSARERRLGKINPER